MVVSIFVPWSCSRGVRVEGAKAESESESDSESLHLAPEVKARRPVSPKQGPKAAPAVGQKRSPEVDQEAASKKQKSIPKGRGTVPPSAKKLAADKRAKIEAEIPAEAAVEVLGEVPPADHLDIPEAVGLHPADQRYEKMATVHGRKTEVPSMIMKRG